MNKEKAERVIENLGNPTQKEIEKFKDLIVGKIDHDIFTPRRLVTLQEKEIDKLISLLDDYWALATVLSDKE